MNETKKVSMFTKLNYIFDKKQKGQLILLAVLILIGGVVETLGVSMMLPVVSAILKPEAIHRQIDKRPELQSIVNFLHIDTDLKLITVLVVVVIFLFVFKNLYLLFLVYKQNTFISRARNDMISRVMREFLNRPYEAYLGADIPTVFRITDSDIPKTFTLMLSILSLATEFVVSTCLGIVLLLVNWQMTLLMIFVLLILTLIITKVLKPRLNRIGRKNQETQSRIAKWRLQAIYGLKDVKVLNRQDFFIRNYYESGKLGADIDRNYIVLNNIPRLLIETVFVAVVLLYVLLYLVNGGDATALLPQISAFGVAAIRIMPSVNRINTYLTQIAYNQFSLDFVYNNLTESMKEDKEMRAERAAIAGPELHLEKEISLKDITFAYPDAEVNIFTDANMVVPKGKSVGIMGPSGAGKSTIVDVLLGLLHVKSGEVLCDGSNIFSNYDSWLAQIGYIPQSIYLVDESIRANIAFGIDEDQIDDNRIWEVMKEAQLADFVKTLPEGLDTRIGDRGVRLSGGQRQRIGIARALYHNPEILVFDEATSALDNETEAAVMEAINSFHGKKTMVIIAHRLNTIANCDIIYEVKDEKIHETSLEGRTIIQ
ncbi:ABC-type bacteriocin/lantibiotic exporter, contains an N-terminal double-glycine peptidase domain [Butyrivibrio hungatei DSM 14810]|uniref:ABC-type bacteriocin/lantibiotic exporter, contains an N-terminal double-glycine peptidase domain n=1 Tax=Butyrivibrio hungatei DSM 14810 TaxID=1121132 RepID=A0A1M7RZP0_9FIRM|nr:ABC transporter ATP-binding protein [Butyrivibrio hungatei]SHN51695.1 ABC-type bacteriocin/lantibiotic exporter, contains an N-terminal double-glycine peptidase domain [Butyrivibrio hungatei DSM 14810]